MLYIPAFVAVAERWKGKEKEQCPKAIVSSCGALLCEALSNFSDLHPTMPSPTGLGACLVTPRALALEAAGSACSCVGTVWLPRLPPTCADIVISTGASKNQGGSSPGSSANNG